MSGHSRLSHFKFPMFLLRTLAAAPQNNHDLSHVCTHLTSLSIWSRTSLSLKYVCHLLSGFKLRGWSCNVTSTLSLSSAFDSPGITMRSSATGEYTYTFQAFDHVNRNGKDTSHIILFSHRWMYYTTLSCDLGSPTNWIWSTANSWATASNIEASSHLHLVCLR